MPTTRRPVTSATRLRVVTKPAAPAIQDAVDDYLAHVSASNPSPRTIEYYSSVLTKVFLPWCAAEKITDLSQLDQRHLDRLNAALLARKKADGSAIAPASVASYLRAVRQLLSWAKKGKLVGADLRVQGVKVPRTIKDTLSWPEIDRLEDAADNERDKLLVRVLGSTGMRLNELLSLTAGDLVKNGHDRYVKVMGKGRRERLIGLKPATWTRLQRYASHGRPLDDEAPVFIARRHRHGELDALTDRAVQKTLNVLGQRAQLGKPVHAHLFRHSFITNILASRGMDPVQLAKVVGHSDLSQIMRTYEHVGAPDLYRQLMAAVPDR